MQTLIKEIFSELNLTEAEAKLIYSKLKRKTFSKGAFILQEDQDINELYYVHEGCLSNYFVDAALKEHILQFAVKGWWISDYIALFGRTKTKSVSCIECIKDSVLYSISKEDFDKICHDLPKVARFHIRKMELAFASFQNRILENLTLPAKQRYTNFVSTYPSIASTVKNYHIASYLGITTESLSRIRKELASNS